MHQVATEEATQLFLQQLLFFLQHQLAERALKPLTRQADQLDPVRVGLGKGLVGHCAIPRKVLPPRHRG
ncbi:MAG TPA: hypothetical protein DIC37_00640 [Pseudomonas sp.]|nr:hypothetical protein [Pseudomonas sp.]